MDVVQKEQGENLEPESMLVPKDTARAFARGLRQSIGPQLKSIDSSLTVLDDSKAPSIKKCCQRIQDLLTRLETSQKVKISTSEDDNEFRFSTEIEEIEEEEFRSGEVTMPNSMVTRFMSALSHTIGNPLQIAVGRAESMQSEEGKRIYSSLKEIVEKMSPFISTRKESVGIKEIKITTDSKGNTTIIPIRYSS